MLVMYLVGSRQCFHRFSPFYSLAETENAQPMIDESKLLFEVDAPSRRPLYPPCGKYSPLPIMLTQELAVLLVSFFGLGGKDKKRWNRGDIKMRLARK